MKLSVDWGLALSAGMLLAVMIDVNSLLAAHSSPMTASWIAHGLGAVGAFILVLAFRARQQWHCRAEELEKAGPDKKINSPFWSYLGGIPGAFTVVLAAVTVNSPIGLSGSLALMLVGQVLFGMLCDYFGLFGIPRRQPALKDLKVVGCTLSGSGLIIFLGA
ncbi:hypothetical protein BTA51_02130 [Hahella sp. CCB-MM4]|uniref:DMT family transporter n=1 Tax=Hahella sp. (strain CCB-MM4) TaxID=1926491 RepID=UPI000B9C3E75|nr:DMT family transporter [Hahella sp. CCB-MM4]OZG75205.1 hypothetical protein BTA51_02130 [Hahella sp. CCB-MM4]